VPGVDEIPPARGPAAPSTGAAVAHRPLGGQDVRLGRGLLHDWQQRNAAASLPLALRQLEAAGNLANLRLAIAGGTEGYRGPVFMDSDLYKVLEAVGWELGRSADQELSGFLAEATALLEKAQQPDGYLNSYMQVTGRRRYSFLASSHEMYCAGHLIQAAIACQRGAGDPGLLRVARRFADHLVDHFLGREEGIDGHPIVETALAELYRETGHEPYLRLASQFIEQRGHGMIGDSGFGRRYLQDHEPVRETTTEVGHVVRALYLEAGVTDVAVEAGDADLLQTALTRWADMPQQQVKYPSEGMTPIRSDVLTPSFAATNPYDAVALRALAKGSVEYTLAYDAVFNEPGSPWFKMLEDAVYNGNMSAALQEGQSGISSTLASVKG
jgi:DUF1680 family protein